jgi:hypothetical protein
MYLWGYLDKNRVTAISEKVLLLKNLKIFSIGTHLWTKPAISAIRREAKDSK